MVRQKRLVSYCRMHVCVSLHERKLYIRLCDSEGGNLWATVCVRVCRLRLCVYEQWIYLRKEDENRCIGWIEREDVWMIIRCCILCTILQEYSNCNSVVGCAMRSDADANG